MSIIALGLSRTGGWIPEEPETPYHSLFGIAFPGSGPLHWEGYARWTAERGNRIYYQKMIYNFIKTDMLWSSVNEADLDNLNVYVK